MTLNKQTLRTLLVTAVLLQIALLVIYFISFSGSLSGEQEIWGQFGDYVGGIMNPIVGLFTLFIVAHAYLLQHKELGETKKALRASADTSVIQSRINIETAFLQDQIGKCDRIHADIQRVSQTSFLSFNKRADTYKFSGDHLEADNIPAYIKGRRNTYKKARSTIEGIKTNLRLLQKELSEIGKVA